MNKKHCLLSLLLLTSSAPFYAGFIKKAVGLAAAASVSGVAIYVGARSSQVQFDSNKTQKLIQADCEKVLSLAQVELEKVRETEKQFAQDCTDRIKQEAHEMQRQIKNWIKK